jgi:hypothetical protein
MKLITESKKEGLRRKKEIQARDGAGRSEYFKEGL